VVSEPVGLGYLTLEIPLQSELYLTLIVRKCSGNRLPAGNIRAAVGNPELRMVPDVEELGAQGQLLMLGQ
jgi:hypothetical protein